MDVIERRKFVFDFTQAALGLVSNNMIAVGFKAIDASNFKAYFFIRTANSETDDDIRNILDDFDALQDVPIKITAEVVVDDSNVIDADNDVFLTYCAKDVSMKVAK